MVQWCQVWRFSLRSWSKNDVSRHWFFFWVWRRAVILSTLYVDAQNFQLDSTIIKCFQRAFSMTFTKIVWLCSFTLLARLLVIKKTLHAISDRVNGVAEHLDELSFIFMNRRRSQVSDVSHMCKLDSRILRVSLGWTFARCPLRQLLDAGLVANT